MSEDKDWWAKRANRLTGPERNRILAGDVSTINRPFKPKFTVGQRLVLVYDRQRPTPIYDRYDDQKIIDCLPAPGAEPLVWIDISNVIRKNRGGWAVHFTVTDLRTRRRYLRRKPPTFDPHVEPREDRVHEDSNYQATRIHAVDDVEAVDDETLDTFVAENHIKDALRDKDGMESKLEAIDGLPTRTERILALHELATSRGIDLHSDMKALERRIRRRLAA